jgi:uncharacterized protein (DUF2252 family)
VGDEPQPPVGEADSRASDRENGGVGSVGTRAFIVLLQGRDAHDPLFLQIKEVTASVLEAYLPKSRYRQHGERVVQGQRLMQAASDIYLRWTKGLDVRRQNEQDFQQFVNAVRAGRLEALEGV